MARLKVIHVPNAMLVALLSLKGNSKIKIEGLPDDAEIVGVSCHQCWDRDMTSFKIKSESFPQIHSGYEITELLLTASETFDPPSEPELPSYVIGR